MTNETERHFPNALDKDLQSYMRPIEVDFDIPEVKRYGGLETTVAVILLGYLILGLSGNLLTIIALLRCPRVRNVTAAFIISLCVADCLFCVLVLPWEVSRFFAGKWVWGKGVICTVLPLIRYWNVAVSLLSIAMITLNRYIMIAHFGIYKSIYKKGWIGLMIAFCWLFPFCILLPTLLGKWGRFGMIEALETCSIIDENGQSPKKVLFGLGFCVPALIIIICYSLIFYVIHKSDSRMRDHNSRAANGTKISGVSLQSKLPGKVDKETRRKKNEWRITKMVMIIFITFLVTYLPITLVKFFDPLANYRALHLLGYVLVYLSCCINPVIYVIMNRQYRQAYRTVLLCRRPRIHSFTSHGEPGMGKTSLKQLAKSINRRSLTNGWRMHDKKIPVINDQTQAPSVGWFLHATTNAAKTSHRSSAQALISPTPYTITCRDPLPVTPASWFQRGRSYIFSHIFNEINALRPDDIRINRHPTEATKEGLKYVLNCAARVPVNVNLLNLSAWALSPSDNNGNINPTFNTSN